MTVKETSPEGSFPERNGWHMTHDGNVLSYTHITCKLTLRYQDGVIAGRHTTPMDLLDHEARCLGDSDASRFLDRRILSQYFGDTI